MMAEIMEAKGVRDALIAKAEAEPDRYRPFVGQVPSTGAVILVQNTRDRGVQVVCCNIETVYDIIFLESGEGAER